MEQIWWWKWNWKRPPVWISSCHVSDDPLSCCHHTLDWCLICNVPPQSDVRWKLSSTGPGPGHGNHDITPQSTATSDPYTLGTYTWPIAELSFIMQTGQLASDIINFSLSAWCRKYSKSSSYSNILGSNQSCRVKYLLPARGNHHLAAEILLARSGKLFVYLYIISGMM